jgi:predicted  nucleic acid-binding Zn-ribbon protein
MEPEVTMSFTRSVLAAPLLALACAAPLVVTGCGGSRDKPQSSKMATEVNQLQAEVEDLRHQIDTTTTSLNLMQTTRTGSDLKQDYKMFVDASGRVDSRADHLSKRSAELRTHREAYLDDWNRNIQSINDPQIKQTQQERLKDVEQRLDQVTKEVDELKTDTDAYRQGLGDLRKTFQYDLTSNGVKAMSEHIDSSQKQAVDIQGKLGEVSGKLSEWSSALRPTA